MAAAAAAWGSSANVAVTTRCSGKLAASMIAVGVEAALPAAIRRALTSPSLALAMNNTSVGAVAKMLGTSQNRLFRDLRNAGVLIAKGAMRNTPYQQYMRYFVVKAHEYERSNGDPGCSYTTYVQPAGIDFIRRKLHLPSIDPQLPMGGAA